MQHSIILGACLALLAVTALPAGAIILSGAIEQVSPVPGTSLANGGFSSDSAIRIFQEKRNYTLSAPLAVNWAGGDLERNNLSTKIAGMTLDSYFIHFDHNQRNADRSARVRFDGMILGLIWEDTALAKSDFLGLEGIFYSNSNGRGFWGNNTAEIGSADFLNLEAPFTIDFTMQAGRSYVDQLRVVTAPIPTPEPSTLLLASFGACVLGICAWRRRRRD